MTIAYWCVLFAGLLPYLATAVAKAGRDYDNRAPRDWLARQSGLRARANAAQANSFEAFPFFAAAVLVACAVHGSTIRTDHLAELFVASRVLYIAAYLANWPTSRSIAWLIGIGSVVALFMA